MNKKIIFGLGLLGGGLAVISRRKGDAVILYQADGSGSPEFERVAEIAGERLGAPIYPVRSAAEVIAAISQHSHIRKLVLIGHGTTRALFRPGTAGVRVGATALPLWLSVDDFSSLLAGRLVRGWVMGIAGCSAGADAGEESWTVGTWDDGGSQSFAAVLRDSLVQHGVLPGVIRAHSMVGHTTELPAIRLFWALDRALGTPGASLLRLKWGQKAVDDPRSRAQWASEVQGDVAERWITAVV